MNAAEVESASARGTGVAHFFSAPYDIVDAPSNDVADFALHADDHRRAADKYATAIPPFLRHFSNEVVTWNVVRPYSMGQSNRLNHDVLVRPARFVQSERPQSCWIADDEISQCVGAALDFSFGRLVEAAVGETKVTECKIGDLPVLEIRWPPLQ